jgi:dGTPase
MTEKRKYKAQLNFRQMREAWEFKHLSERASKSGESRGRQREEEPCELRTAFQRDRDRVLHSKAFRRLKHKTQVFIAPEGDHYRTRLTHTLEVSVIARTVAGALRLNEDLSEAIALAHDLGHPPFGHSGEKFLDEIMRSRGFDPGFLHNIQSLRVVDEFENDGKGLNLTEETRNGIQFHTKGMDDITVGISEGKLPYTEEGRVVRISDRFAYLYADLEDALRAGFIRYEQIPVMFDEPMREKPSLILNKLVKDLVKHSAQTGWVSLSEETVNFIDNLKDYLNEQVYKHSSILGREPQIRNLIFSLFERIESERSIYDEHVKMPYDSEQKKLRNICDYIAGMTDHYAITIFERLFVPKTWESF